MATPEVREEEPMVGPEPAPRVKRKRPLQMEQAYLDSLPCANMYEKSYMHRDVVTHVAISSADFFITGSIDGHLKFWKKKGVGIEFAKSFHSHLGPIQGLAVSLEGLLCCTISNDHDVKIYDVVNYDMMAMIRLPYIPSAVEWTETPPLCIFMILFLVLSNPLVRNRYILIQLNAVFDESSNFLIYATLLGIKIVNLHTNTVARILGKVESNERYLRVALYQGGGKKVRKIPAAAANVNESKEPLTDPTIISCAFKKDRIYMFSRREPEEPEDVSQGRDVFNEKPASDELIMSVSDIGNSATTTSLPENVIIHTTMGDMHIKLYSEECPKTVENFTTLCRNGYYHNQLFHRVIKGFMVQTGDPLGDGTGGHSIWGGKFEDEFHKSLRHDRPFTVSMANAGPNTNGSQFFITTVDTPWLDNKHTVFGRVVKGMDVVQGIEKVKTDKNERPYQDVKILNVSVPKS
ncbi:unnamed protein product [Eruca vesicaria subsp. sativa]|uniref:peptidylprolyl isomerase n=1 Tax=Eruca vesicaria subsp. sativa TaxID=29727 RepID=A0ABC8IWG0_ERUVS|nr:unnamed protein product [Eruca vesicaria subsp. sativa]